MQRAYISKLLELAEQDRNLLHLVADSGTGFDEMFRRNFPRQMMNFGIAEEHMVAAAAGLATAGKIPFVYTAGAFLAYRSLEFIRDDICFQNLNVKLTGMGSGLAWSTLGPTHHTTEDVAVLRALPNLTIYSPASPRQVSACVEAAYAQPGPAYIRIGMNNEKELFEEGYALPDRGYEVLAEGADGAVFVTGSIVEEVLEAEAMLRREGIRIGVVHVHRLKPFDREAVRAMARAAGLLVSVEEHNRYGGLGTELCEAAAQEGLAVKVRCIGLEDVFAVGYGTQKSVRADNGLDALSIYRKLKEDIRAGISI